MHRRLAAAVTLSVTLLLGACTDDVPKPPPSPSSAPTMPSPPTSSSPSRPSLSPGAAKHSDFLEIQELYKTEFAEEIQVLKDGGADELPPSIRKRTTGSYQKDVLDSFRSEKKAGTRQTVGGRLLGIAMDTWTPSTVTFRSCEDYSKLKLVDRHGKPIHRKPGVRAIQKFTVVKKGGSWLLKSAEATVVNDFRGASCNGKWYS